MLKSTVNDFQPKIIFSTSYHLFRYKTNWISKHLICGIFRLLAHAYDCNLTHEHPSHLRKKHCNLSPFCVVFTMETSIWIASQTGAAPERKGVTNLGHSIRILFLKRFHVLDFYWKLQPWNLATPLLHVRTGLNCFVEIWIKPAILCIGVT